MAAARPSSSGDSTRVNTPGVNLEGALALVRDSKNFFDTKRLHTQNNNTRQRKERLIGQLSPTELNGRIEAIRLVYDQRTGKELFQWCCEQKQAFYMVRLRRTGYERRTPAIQERDRKALESCCSALNQEQPTWGKLVPADSSQTARGSKRKLSSNAGPSEHERLDEEGGGSSSTFTAVQINRSQERRARALRRVRQSSPKGPWDIPSAQTHAIWAALMLCLRKGCHYHQRRVSISNEDFEMLAEALALGPATLLTPRPGSNPRRLFPFPFSQRGPGWMSPWYVPILGHAIASVGDAKSMYPHAMYNDLVAVAKTNFDKNVSRRFRWPLRAVSDTTICQSRPVVDELKRITKTILVPALALLGVSKWVDQGAPDRISNYYVHGFNVQDERSQKTVLEFVNNPPRGDPVSNELFLSQISGRLIFYVIEGSEDLMMQMQDLDESSGGGGAAAAF